MVSINPSTHVCHLFRGDDEQKSFTLGFIRDGLENGEFCAHISTGRPDDWYFEFQVAGIDVCAQRAGGALEVLDAVDWYRELQVNTLRMAKTVWGTLSGALINFGSVRLAADMRWLGQSDLSPDSLCHWEAAANAIFEDTATRVVCQYALDQEPSEILAALRTHPLVVLDGRLVTNPHYEAPRILSHEPRLNHTEADSDQIDRLLAGLRLLPAM